MASANRAIPCPPSRALTSRRESPRLGLKYRPHSAKAERHSETNLGMASKRPLTAKSRMYSKSPGAAAQRLENPGTVAHRVLPKTLSDQSGDALAKWHEGIRLMLEERYDESITILNAALEQYPLNTAIMVSLAKALIDGFGEFDRFHLFLTEIALAIVCMPLTLSSEFDRDQPSTHNYAYTVSYTHLTLPTICSV